MGKPATLKIDIITDASQTTSELDSVSSKFDATDKAMESTGSKADALGGHFDETATKTATVAGGLGDLGGALEQAGGPVGKLGQGMQLMQGPIMGVAGASDLATVAFEKLRLGTLKDTAATIAHKVASVASAAATKAMAAVQWLLNAAMSANPIGIVVVALAALTAGFIVAYKKSETFRNIVKGALDVVKKAMTAVADGAKAVYDVVVGSFQKILDWFRNSPIATVLFAPYKAAYDLISGGPKKLYEDFARIPAGIARALKGVTKAITGPFEDAFKWISKFVIDPIKSVWNTVAGVINSISFSVKTPSWLGPFGGKGWEFDPPDVPTLARGAYLNRASLAVVGEAGPEFVTPEPMLRRLIRDEMGGGRIQITVNGALDPDAVARQIDKILRARAQRVGGVTRRGAGATA